MAGAHSIGQRTRAFIAIDISDDVRTKLYSTAGALAGTGISIVPEENIHITLLFLGSLGNDELDSVKRRLLTIRKKQFQVSIKGIGSFGEGSPRVLFAKVDLGAAEVMSLYDAITASLSDTWPAHADRRLTPHATLARIRREGASQEVVSFIAEHSDDSFGAFTCTSFSLKSSVQAGATQRYATLCSVGLVT